MKNQGLTVIRGGLCTSFDKMEKEFASAYVTDTRLMGVVAMCIKWKTHNEGMDAEYFQLFYYDVEEYGLDTYKGISSHEMEHFHDSEASMIGGLGGKKVPITLEEAKYLVGKFVAQSIERGIELPEGKKEYMPLAYESGLLDEKAKPILDAQEAYDLMQKICGPILNDYQLINYFVMRCFGKDFEGANFLAEGFKTKDYWPSISQVTLCKNTIDRIDRPYGKFMCESVLDVNDSYYIATSLIEIEDQKVISFEPIKLFKISAIEASLMLNRSEFVTVVDYIGHVDDFNRHTSALTEKAMISEHEFGEVYMIYNPTNAHVAKKVFNLNADVFGVYYHSESNQIVLAAYSEENIGALESDLKHSNIGALCIWAGRYQFEQPVLFKYIQSGFERFEDFVEALEDE